MYARVPSRVYRDDVIFICKIRGKEAIEKEYGLLKNFDIVLTEERRKHILERRGPKDYALIMKYLKSVLIDFDELYDDSRGNKTGVCFVKEVEDGKKCVIYVALSFQSEEFANSQITGMLLNEYNFVRFVKGRKSIA